MRSWLKWNDWKGNDWQQEQMCLEWGGKRRRQILIWEDCVKEGVGGEQGTRGSGDGWWRRH